MNSDTPQRRLLSEGVAFIAVGLVNTAVGYAIFFILTTWVFGALPFGYLASLALSYVFAIPLAYVLYHRYVFTSSTITLRGFWRFVAVNVTAIVLNFIGLPMAVEWAAMSPQTAQLVVLAVVVVVSYIGHKFFSFGRRG